MRGQLSIISGRSNKQLAMAAARAAGTELRPCEIRTFSDGELSVEINANVRGHDVFVIQSTSTPGNDHLMELLIIMDALRRSSAERVTAVVPYYGYGRQDRKTKPRVPITAKLVAELLVSSGANRVLTMDLHAGQIMGFFNVPVDNLYARPVMLRYMKDKYSPDDLVIVSPDAGGVARARAFAKRLNVNLAIIDKRRVNPNEVAEMNVVGDVKGKVAVLIDDIVDTGGTLAKGADALIEAGATEVLACCTHAVLSGAARKNLKNSRLSKLIVTDTIQQTISPEDSEWLVQLSVGQIIGEAIKRINMDDSVSSLFGDE
jgi:ribose-phosphate pyrophosphokinase